MSKLNDTAKGVADAFDCCPNTIFQHQKPSRPPSTPR
jgi:hypothetical protein